MTESTPTTATTAPPPKASRRRAKNVAPTAPVAPRTTRTVEAIKAFDVTPRPLTYPELQLPDDWEPRWSGEAIEGFAHLVAKLAEEVWARTAESTHDAATARAELEAKRDLSSLHTRLELESAQTVELFAVAGQAALVGWALGQTMDYSSDAELWIQQAMALVGLRVITSEARRAARDATFTAYEEMYRLNDAPAPDRPDNWALAPTDENVDGREGWISRPVRSRKGRRAQ